MYSAKSNIPTLYIVHKGKNIGRVPVFTKEPAQLDSNLLHIQTSENEFHVDAADAKGNIIATITYTLQNDGGFKGSGGGYLLYDTYSKEKYKVAIAFNGKIL